MFIKDNKYLIGLTTPVVFVGNTEIHYIFKGEHTEFYISKNNLLSVRQPFKFIKL